MKLKLKSKYKKNDNENESVSNSTKASDLDTEEINYKYIFENRKLSNLKKPKLNSTHKKSNNKNFTKKNKLYRNIKLKQKINIIINNIIIIITKLFVISILIICVISLFSIIDIKYYKNIVIKNQFEKFFNKLKSFNAKDQFITDLIEKNNNISENFNHIEKKIEEIEKNIIGVNKKVGFLTKVNYENKNINFTHIDKRIEEIFYDRFKLIKDDFNKQILNMEKYNLNNFKYYNESIIKSNINYKKNELNKEIIKKFNKKIDSILNNITEIEETTKQFKKEFDHFSEQIKLIDEAQDILRSMLLSMNKRNEDQLILNSNLIKNHEINNDIQLYISRIIRLKYEMQGYELVDWAQSSMGGKVIYPKKNKFCISSNKKKSLVIKALNYFGIKFIQYMNYNYKYITNNNIPIYNRDCFEPNKLVKSGEIKSIGNCLPISVGSFIIIEMSTNINVTAIGIDHILFPLEYDKGNTVPRNISVECYEEPFKNTNIEYITYYYPQNNDGLQIYKLNKSIICKKIKFQIISTYGSKYACLYKFRIYGQPSKNLISNNQLKSIQFAFFFKTFELFFTYSKYLTFYLLKLSKYLFSNIGNIYKQKNISKIKKNDQNYENDIYKIDYNQKNLLKKNNSEEIIKIHSKKREREFK